MKARLKTLFVALGFTTLALVWIPGPLNRDTFYWAGRPLTLFLPSVLDFVLAWLLIAFVLYRVRRPGRARRILWSGMIAFAPVLALETYALLPGTYVSSSLRLVVGLLGLLMWLLLLSVFAGLFARHSEPIIGAASVLLIFLSANGVYVLAHSTWLAWQARHLNTISLSSTTSRLTPAGRPRIIWIVMDELSYKQVYGHRMPGLSLPAFDALARQASIFTNATPAANMTEFAMPDYMTGIPDGHDYYDPNGQFDIGRLDNGQRMRFNQYDTIFQDAHRDGYNTGLAGWFIPYCRLLPNVLDTCFQSYNQPNRNGMLASSGMLSNLFAPVRRIAAYAVPKGLHTRFFTLRSNGIVEREEHIKDYRSISAAADTLLLDPNIGFMLVHLPIPHLPGVFDRHTGRLNADKDHGYLDNLALADQCLAHIRSVLQSTGQWDASTVLVMGDHSWRLGAATAEDEIAKAAGFDIRPAYIVKLAGQQHAAAIDVSYDALRTRSLLQALLTRQVRTPEDLSAWAASKNWTPKVVSPVEASR